MIGAEQMLDSPKAPPLDSRSMGSRFRLIKLKRHNQYRDKKVQKLIADGGAVYGLLVTKTIKAKKTPFRV